MAETKKDGPIIGYDHQAKPADSPTGTVRVKGKGALADEAKRLNAEPDAAATGTQTEEGVQGQQGGNTTTTAPGSPPAATKKPGDSGAATTTTTTTK